MFMDETHDDFGHSLKHSFGFVYRDNSIVCDINEFLFPAFQQSGKMQQYVRVHL